MRHRESCCHPPRCLPSRRTPFAGRPGPRHPGNHPAARAAVIAAALTLTGVLPCLAEPASNPASSRETAMPTKVVTVEGITEYRLENGLRALLFPDPSTSAVTVNLTVFVGSRHEGYGETGMAHLLEHMVFKGTPTHPDVPKALRDHGAQFNGTTWVDRTNYFETMNATDANLEFALKLEADRLVNSNVKREDLVSEMTVVRNEFESGENNPDYILSQRMMAAAYEWHNYGKSTIGNRSDIERVPIERLRAFYHKYYQPDNCMLVVAGNFDEAKALSYIGKYFGGLKRPARSLDATYTEEPAQDGERNIILRRVGLVGLVGLIYHIPAGAHPDFAAVEVLQHILTSQPSGRLYKALVPTKKATEVSGVAYGWHDPGVLELGVQVEAAKSDTLHDVRDAAIEIVEKTGGDGVTAEEVDRARRELVKNRELLMSKSNRIGITLSEWGAKGDWRLFFLHSDRVEKVTPADVKRVAEMYLKRSNRTVGLFIPADRPDRAPVPVTPDVEELVANYKSTRTIAQGEAFEPTPANIEKRVRRTVTPDGLKIAMLPKKTRGESVTVRMNVHYGNESSLRGITSATPFLGPLMSRGTAGHTRQQLKDELDKLKSSLTLSGQLGDLQVTIETRREQLPAVMKILREILREPSFPAEEFDVLKRERRDLIEKSMTEPTALAPQALRRKLAPHEPDDVRYQPTFEELLKRIDAVTLDTVKTLYKEQLGGGHTEVAVVGDVDPAEFPKLAEDLVKDWKAGVPYKRISSPANTSVPGGHETIQTPDKENAFYIAALTLAMTDKDPDFPALELGNFIFGGGALSSRLGNRVRQKEGLSYGVRSQFNADAMDKAARFLMYAIYNPAVAAKLDRVMTEELEKFLADGPTEKEVTEGKKAWLETRKTARASDAGLAHALAEGLFENRTFQDEAELDHKITDLTAAEIGSAVKRNWVPSRLVVIQAGDFAKKSAAPTKSEGKK